MLCQFYRSYVKCVSSRLNKQPLLLLYFIGQWWYAESIWWWIRRIHSPYFPIVTGKTYRELLIGIYWFAEDIISYKSVFGRKIWIRKARSEYFVGESGAAFRIKERQKTNIWLLQSLIKRKEPRSLERDSCKRNHTTCYFTFLLR